jgi:hypothetical protein
MAGELAQIIAEAARRYGQDPQTLARIAQIESSMNPSARNPRSSAAGLFQFIDSTAGRYGLTNKLDPVAASDATARLTRDNAAYLGERLGRQPTPAELYLAHQQGAGGAAKILANPQADASTVVGPQAVALNGGRPGMTAGDFAGLWTNKFNGAKVLPADVGGPAVATPLTPGGSTAAMTIPVDPGAVAARNVLAQNAASQLTGLFGQQAAQQKDEETARQTKRAALLGKSLSGLYG